MLTLRELKDTVGKSDGFLFYLTDMVYCCYVEHENHLAVLDVSEGPYASWVCRSARRLLHLLYEAGAEDDFEVVVDCGDIVRICANSVALEGENIVLYDMKGENHEEVL